MILNISSWYDETHHLYRKRVDTFTGEFQTIFVPCGSPNCRRSFCRSAYLEDTENALWAVANAHERSTLVVAHRLTGFGECKQVHRVLLEAFILAMGRDEANAAFTVEPHKAGYRDEDAPGGLHLNALFFHDGRLTARKKRIIRDHVDRFFPGLGDELHFTPKHRSSPDRWPGYILKNYGSHPKEHLARNGGHIFLSTTRGFWHLPGRGKVSNARRAAKDQERSRQKVYWSLRDLVDDPDRFRRQNPTLDGDALLSKALRLQRQAKSLLDRKRLSEARGSILRSLTGFRRVFTLSNHSNRLGSNPASPAFPRRE